MAQDISQAGMQMSVNELLERLGQKDMQIFWHEKNGQRVVGQLFALQAELEKVQKELSELKAVKAEIKEPDGKAESQS